MKDHRGIFDNEHEFCCASREQIGGEAFLVALIERILRVRAEFTIIWRIKKNKVVGTRCVCLQESLKVRVLNDRVSKVLLYLWRLHIGNLSCQIFSVVRDPPVGNIEL